MDQQKKPRAREKRVAESGYAVEKKGEGLGTGPVNNAGNYSDRKAQQPAQRPASSGGMSGKQVPLNSFRPGQTVNQPSASRRENGTAPENPDAGRRTVHYRPPQSSSGQSAFGGQGSGGQQPRPGYMSGNFRGSSRPAGTSGSNTRPGAEGRGTPPSGGSPQRGGSGSGKLLPLILILLLVFGGGKLSGLFDSGEPSSVVSGSGNLPASQQTSPPAAPAAGSSSGLGSSGLTNLLGSLFSAGSGSVYDFTGVLPSLGSSPSNAQPADPDDYFTSAASGSSSGAANTSVSPAARAKYTTVRGNHQDQVTVLVYMCGTDLESRNGMGTADLKEMANADLTDQLNLVVYTGGCKNWRNNVVSSQKNQIYQIRNGGIYCLEENMGTGAMTDPRTLAEFIRYGAKNFPANRMCLIFWDHGGGSVTGFGYDEKYGRKSMTLAEINNALKQGGITFDFVGFDACLMATVENAVMLSQYADYMIASEETEPGVGWYYTNWLSRLSSNTGMPTVEIGKTIADDFVAVCNRKCRGQGTTLSVVDLAELQTSLPPKLKAFSQDTNELIQQKNYKKVSLARGNSREFAQSSRIDQIDLVHFARNLDTEESRELAEVLQSAVKYNRTGGGISNAYGLSIYFPYKQAKKVSQMVSTYQAIGMDEDYTRCIQEFASLEVSGQIASGNPITGYTGEQTTVMPSLLGSLLGNAPVSVSSSQDSLTGLLSGLFSGESVQASGGVLDFFTGRSMTAAKAAEYIAENRLDPGMLQWDNDRRIVLSAEQWSLVECVRRNVFLDDGKGFIDLGMDNDYDYDNLVLCDRFDGTWLSIDRHPVAYYYLYTIEDGDQYLISGYVPCLLNGSRANLILNFDSERPEGYIAGAQIVYPADGPEAEAKTLIQIGQGDQVAFLCDYFDYEGNYQETYHLGDPITLGPEVEIINIPLNSGNRKVVSYCLTDIYQQNFWTQSVTYP